MPHILDRISIADIRSRIKRLELQDTRSLDYDYTLESVAKLMTGYSQFPRTLDAQYGFRARLHDTQQLYEHVSELWYPPAETVKRFGRLNPPGKSLLYLAANRDIATLEVRPRRGDFLTTLSVRLKNANACPTVFELGVHDKAVEHGKETDIRLVHTTTHGLQLLGGHSNAHNNSVIRHFLARHMTRAVDRGEEHRFKISAAIGEILLKGGTTDGVQYPTIAGDGTGDWGQCIALKPAAADRLYEPCSCYLSVVEHAKGPPDFDYQLRCLRTSKSIAHSGEIVWD